MADEERPKNVKELLVELKDASELMVDLAYAAVFFNEENLAEEVEELEQQMDEHLRRLREVAMLAARSPEDAEAMAGVLSIAIVIVFGYYIAVVSFRFGLDPDNQSVPIITSVMDLAGVVAFLFVLSLFGVTSHG